MKIEIIKLEKLDLLEQARAMGFKKGCIYLNHDGNKRTAFRDPYLWNGNPMKIALGEGDGLICLDGKFVGKLIKEW